jgi:phospholipid-binding lipoprotein MlaA
MQSLNKKLLGALALAGLLAIRPAVAADPADPAADDAVELAAALADDAEVNDPIEPINRTMFGINEYAQIFLMPIAGPYAGLTPQPIKDAVGGVLSNLKSPVVFMNDMLQGEWERALQTVQRFFINSILGVGGVYDVADKHFGIPPHKEDFGQTLAVWGVPEPIYLVIPLIGPSSVRDFAGRFVDDFFDPLTTYDRFSDNDTVEAINAGRTVGSAIHEYGNVMADLEGLRKSSVDFYATIRSIYRQKRNAEIMNGKPSGATPLPSFSYDLNGEEGLATPRAIQDVPPASLAPARSTTKGAAAAPATEPAPTIQSSMLTPSSGYYVQESLTVAQ